MSGVKETAPAADDDAPQALVDFMENDAWEALVADVGVRLEALDQLPDSETKDQVYALLQGIDAIHREALHRLVRLFKEGVQQKVITDPAIHTLMELYDLLPAAVTEQTSGTDSGSSKGIPIQMVGPAAAPASAPGPTTTPAVIAHWVPALADQSELDPGACLTRVLDGQALLLCRVDGKVFAMDARCAVDGAPLVQPQLERYTLVCPEHPGCYYDIRQGSRMGGGAALRCHPVQVERDGRVLVGFGIPFVPELPSF